MLLLPAASAAAIFHAIFRRCRHDAAFAFFFIDDTPLRFRRARRRFPLRASATTNATTVTIMFSLRFRFILFIFAADVAAMLYFFICPYHVRPHFFISRLPPKLILLFARLPPFLHISFFATITPPCHIYRCRC